MDIIIGLLSDLVVGALAFIAMVLVCALIMVPLSLARDWLENRSEWFSKIVDVSKIIYGIAFFSVMSVVIGYWILNGHWPR